MSAYASFSLVRSNGSYQCHYRTFLSWCHSSHVPVLLRELKQKRKRHLKMRLRVSAIISQLIQVITLAKWVLRILEFNRKSAHIEIRTPNWKGVVRCSRQDDCKTGHFTTWKERAAKCQKMKYARAKRAKVLLALMLNLHICDVLVAFVVAWAPFCNEATATLLHQQMHWEFNPSCYQYSH